VGGDKVTVRQALFLGKDGKQLQSDFETKSTASFILQGTDTIPGLITALTGVKTGSRVLFAIPPAEAFGTNGRAEAGIGPTDNLVVVADIVSVGKVLKQAEGAAVAPVAGQPTVGFDATNGPTITVPKTAAPTALVSQNLIDGTGPEVKTGQTITVHYTGALWTDGTVFDSSWKRKSPATFAIGTGNVIPGWDKGLVGKKVGSRVLLVVPPADGYADKVQGQIPANSTLVFVVDILDAS
jgi:peptidylprolyl isomerase